ncbi:Triphosphoribosyl-dephospho-CoA synthetase [Polaromonas sp. CG9_12]|nr:Triphosphoribosyl-dephospho-CoA synthetase [Polaromonas sp. CG9_12]
MLNRQPRLSPLVPLSAQVTPASGLYAQRLGRAAIAALYDELALEPKPGLVSFADTGSHSDMDAHTFMRSLFSLRHYFPQIARHGSVRAPFEQLEALGIAAESRMLKATGGINTHRGAVFTLGLLCAAAGALGSKGERPSAARLQRMLMLTWGDALQLRCHRSTASNGHRAAQAHRLRSAGEEAALGFPTLFECAVPALTQARCLGLDDGHSRLHTFFHIMARLDDTNLVHRGGLPGLRFAQQQARAFVQAGGAARPDARVHALAIHRAFVARRLSPGGAADVLAAAGLVERVCLPA